MLLYFVAGTVVQVPGLVQACGQRRPALAQQLVKGGASYLRNRGVERLEIGGPELIPERRYSLESAPQLARSSDDDDDGLTRTSQPCRAL